VRRILIKVAFWQLREFTWAALSGRGTGSSRSS